MKLYLGLKGIARVGDNVIRDIMENRPYASLEDFVVKLNGGERTKVSKDRVVMLIKAGSFDELEKDQEQRF